MSDPSAKTVGHGAAVSQPVDLTRDAIANYRSQLNTVMTQGKNKEGKYDPTIPPDLSDPGTLLEIQRIQNVISMIINATSQTTKSIKDSGETTTRNI